MPLRTPLFDWHKAHGGHLVDFAGWEMPIRYGTITEEHQAVRSQAGLFDISHMGRLVFKGDGAVDFLQKIYTNDVATMKKGQVRYGLICDEAGCILDDVLLYRFESFWLLVVNASNREKILAWLAQYQPKGGVTIEDKTRDWAMVAVQGPAAVKLLPKAGFDFSPLRYYFAEDLSTSPGARIYSRTGYTGEDGCEVILPADQAADYCSQLLAIAVAEGIGLKPCGLGARDTLRLEAAMPLYGHELSETIDPLQADLSWAVKLNKGDFVGKKGILERQNDRNRPFRVGLEIEGKRIAREGAQVLRQGDSVGIVSSGTYAPTLSKAIAMAYVHPSHATVGTQLEVDIRGKPSAARVVPLPFYRRPKA